MSQRQRLSMLAIAVGIAVAAFIVLRPGDDSSDGTSGRANAADEEHLHGYDISKPVGPGRTARYTFTADIEGIFELELENAGVELAELKVEP